MRRILIYVAVGAVILFASAAVAEARAPSSTLARTRSEHATTSPAAAAQT